MCGHCSRVEGDQHVRVATTQPVGCSCGDVSELHLRGEGAAGGELFSLLGLLLFKFSQTIFDFISINSLFLPSSFRGFIF